MCACMFFLVWCAYKERGKDLPSLPTDKAHWIPSAQFLPPAPSPQNQETWGGGGGDGVSTHYFPSPSIPSGRTDLKQADLTWDLGKVERSCKFS